MIDHRETLAERRNQIVLMSYTLGLMLWLTVGNPSTLSRHNRPTGQRNIKFSCFSPHGENHCSLRVFAMQSWEQTSVPGFGGAYVCVCWNTVVPWDVAVHQQALYGSVGWAAEGRRVCVCVP